MVDIKPFIRPNIGQMEKPHEVSYAFYQGKKIVTIIIVIILVVVAGYWFFGQSKPMNYLATFQIKEGGWQAIFLDNGQTYFGRITSINENVVVLEEIYYLQGQPALQTGEQPKETDLYVRKLGREAHGPEDKMIIPLNAISYLENLSNDSTIVRSISRKNEKESPVK